MGKNTLLVASIQSCPSCMLHFRLQVEKRRQSETPRGAHARFEPAIFKSLRKLSFFPSADLISHLACDENGNENHLHHFSSRLSPSIEGALPSKREHTAHCVPSRGSNAQRSEEDSQLSEEAMHNEACMKLRTIPTGNDRRGTRGSDR